MMYRRMFRRHAFLVAIAERYMMDHFQYISILRVDNQITAFATSVTLQMSTMVQQQESEQDCSHKVYLSVKFPQEFDLISAAV
jgi:hypothetical protein